MKRNWLFCGAFIGLAIVVLLYLSLRYHGERYQIVHAVFVPLTNEEVLLQHSGVFYSNKQLRDAAFETSFLERVGMKAFNLDEPDLIACIIPNYTVEQIVGRQDFGLIVVRKSATNGVSFTVFKGTKRFLQFNHPHESQQNLPLTH